MAHSSSQSYATTHILKPALLHSLRQTFVSIGPRLSLTHTQNKHLLNQATIPKPPTLPNLIYPSSVFPLTLPPNCIVLQIQNPSCRLPTKVALDTHSAHTHTLQNTRTMELKGPSGMNEAWERGTGRMKEGDSNERD